MLVQMQDLADHPHGFTVLGHAHGFDHCPALRSDLADTVDHRGGKGIFEEGVVFALVVDFGSGEDCAGDVVDNVSGVYDAFKHIGIGAVLHHALQGL